MGYSHRLPNRYANWYPSNSPINRISMVTNNRNKTCMLRAVFSLGSASRQLTRRRSSVQPVSNEDNLGCLHPVVRVISYDVGFNPSTQRHYRRLIYYLYIHSYMFRSYDHHQAEIE
jgi:hypothetical protein